MSKTYEPIQAMRVAFLGLGVMGHPMAGVAALAPLYLSAQAAALAAVRL